MIDSRNIDDLHPALERAAKELARRMKERGYSVLVTSTYRDSEAQNALYAKGRTSAGSIVTYARGGESIHNYRLAFDICKNLKGGEYSDSAFFEIAGKIGMEMGLDWGGSWVGFKDMPHFEFTGGFTLSQLKKGAYPAENIRLKWENEEAEAAEVVDKTVILAEGTEIEVERIFKDGTNYIKLRELEKFGFAVGYDEKKKMPVINFNS